MLYSTGPAIVLTLIVFFFIGLTTEPGPDVDDSKIALISNGIKDNYSLNILTLLPPILVVILAMKKVGGLAVMVIASIAGALLAIFLQGDSLANMLEFMNYGYKSKVGITEVDKLLSGGGLQNMMWTISLGFVALAMGGLFEKIGLLAAILEKMQKFEVVQQIMVIQIQKFLKMKILTNFLIHWKIFFIGCVNSIPLPGKKEQLPLLVD